MYKLASLEDDTHEQRFDVMVARVVVVAVQKLVVAWFLVTTWEILAYGQYFP